MPLTGALAHEQEPQHQTETPGNKEHPRPIDVKDRSDPEPAKERQEHIDAEDPSDCTFSVFLELMGCEIFLKNANFTLSEHSQR